MLVTDARRTAITSTVDLLAVLPMNSTVGISPYFTIPKGVDRIEGGFGGFASHGLSTMQMFPDYSVVPVLPAGLRLAAAAALKALAESGRSTVFFEHTDDAETTSGTVHTHNKLSIKQAMMVASCVSATQHLHSNLCKLTHCVVFFHTDVMQMVSQSSKMEAVSSPRQQTKQQLPLHPPQYLAHPRVHVTTPWQPSLEATGAPFTHWSLPQLVCTH